MQCVWYRETSLVPQTYELSAEWSDFETSVKTETRLFNREAEATLDSVLLGLTEHKTKAGNPVFVLACPGTALVSLYRARVFHTDEKLEAALARPDLEVGHRHGEQLLPVGRIHEASRSFTGRVRKRPP
jgi:hypothetical protein